MVGSKINSILGFGVVVGLAIAGPSLAVGAGVPDNNPSTSGVMTKDQITAAGQKLAAAIKAELSTRPDTTSSEDQEAVIVFVVSQGNYRDDVIANALDVLDVGASENAKSAIANVRLALLKKKLNRGTAALGSGTFGSGGGFGGSSFTVPGVNTGGGSSNYSQ